MKTIFRESQKFTQWGLWLILIGVAILPILGMYKQFILGGKYGDNPMSKLGLVLFSVFVFGLLGLFWLMRLKTEIDQKEIRMRFIPFVRRNVEWKAVKSAKIVNYGFVGGWGIRLFTRYGTGYNISGNKGLAIELKSGKKFLIGTQKQAELTEIISKLHKPYSQ